MNTKKETATENKRKKQLKLNAAGKVRKNSKTAVKAVTKRKRNLLRFQSCGTKQGWRYITSVPITADRNMKLPKALLAIVPEEIKERSDATPMLSIMLNKKEKIAVLFCKAIHSEWVLNGDEWEMIVPKPIQYPKDSKAE